MIYIAMDLAKDPQSQSPPTFFLKKDENKSKTFFCKSTSKQSVKLCSTLQGIDFATFTGHMCVGIIFVGFVGYAALRLLYRDINKLKNQDPPEIAGNAINPQNIFFQDIKQAFLTWKHTVCLFQMLKYISWSIKRRAEARDRVVAAGGGACVRCV